MSSHHDELTVVTCNTHAGALLRGRGLRWLIKRYDPDVVVLQEVRRFAALLLNVVLRGWWHTERHHAGTIILVRKRKGWRALRATDRKITRGPLNRGYQPERRLTTLVFRDHQGRTIAVGDCHTWAMGDGLGPKANPHVAKAHIAQVDDFASWAHSWTLGSHTFKAADLVLVAGDFNEDLSKPPADYPGHWGTKTARAQLQRAGLRSSRLAKHDRWAPTGLEHGATLDEVFYTGRVTVRSHTVTAVPCRGMDHRAVAVTFAWS